MLRRRAGAKRKPVEGIACDLGEDNDMGLGKNQGQDRKEAEAVRPKPESSGYFSYY